MTGYLAGESWEVALDMRDYRDWPQRQMRKPDGILRMVVALRRSGKTWFLNGLKNQLGKDAASTVLDLRDEESRSRFLQGTDLPENTFLDEPSWLLRVDPVGFVAACQRHSRNNIRLLLAASVGEYLDFRAADATRKFSEKDLFWLLSFDESEANRLLNRGKPAPAVQSVFAALPDQWKSNPFLLELILQTASQNGDLCNDLKALCAATVEVAADTHHQYAASVFHKGLNESLRNCLRDIRDGKKPDDGFVQCLQKCRLISNSSGRWQIIDPVLAEWLQPPFRIHHVSDVHVGVKSAKVADNKTTGALGTVLDTGAGVIFSRDSYLNYVEQRQANGTGPHLVIVSGDLIERDPASELPDAIKWAERLKTLMSNARHPGLRNVDRRIVIVGGNHDVNRLKSLKLKEPSERHTEFAKAFLDYGPPRLDLPPDSPERKVCCTRLTEAGIDILCLASAEFGSESRNDPKHAIVAEELEGLLNKLGDETLTAEQKKSIFDRIEWIDPGLVHSEDLKKAAEHQWTMPVRIAVLHHPVSALPSMEIAPYTGLLNAGPVKYKLLEAGFQLILHGHVHYAAFVSETWFVNNCRKQIHISSAASLGSYEKDQKNGFNEIEVLWEGTHCELRMTHYVRDGDMWTASGQSVEVNVITESE